MKDDQLKKKLLDLAAKDQLNYLKEYPKVYDSITYRTRGTDRTVKEFIKEFTGLDYNPTDKRRGEIRPGSLKLYLTKEKLQKHMDAGLNLAEIGKLYGVTRQYIKKLHDEYFTEVSDGNNNM